jgi:hypothetical protein
MPWEKYNLQFGILVSNVAEDQLKIANIEIVHPHVAHMVRCNHKSIEEDGRNVISEIAGVSGFAYRTRQPGIGERMHCKRTAWWFGGEGERGRTRAWPQCDFNQKEEA